jgi:hypothetical protein
MAHQQWRRPALLLALDRGQLGHGSFNASRRVASAISIGCGSSSGGRRRCQRRLQHVCQLFGCPRKPQKCFLPITSHSHHALQTQKDGL